MRQAEVHFKGEKAGLLTQHDDGSFSFRYDDFWWSDSAKPSISLTFPKINQEYHSKYLFPFFYNMLPEGANRQVVCRLKRIDTDDYFSILIFTARYDVIGAVTVIKADSQ